MSSAAKSLSKPSADASKSSAAELENVHDDFDDFDPRGSSTTGKNSVAIMCILFLVIPPVRILLLSVLCKKI